MVDIAFTYGVCESYRRWVRGLCWLLFGGVPVGVVGLVVYREGRTVALADVLACAGAVCVGQIFAVVVASMLTRAATRQADGLLQLLTRN